MYVTVFDSFWFQINLLIRLKWPNVLNLHYIFRGFCWQKCNKIYLWCVIVCLFSAFEVVIVSLLTFLQKYNNLYSNHWQRMLLKGIYSLILVIDFVLLFGNQTKHSQADAVNISNQFLYYVSVICIRENSLSIWNISWQVALDQVKSK